MLRKTCVSAEHKRMAGADPGVFEEREGFSKGVLEKAGPQECSN